MAIEKILILFGILLILSLLTCADEKSLKSSFDPEDIEYYLTIGQQIAKFMCRHFNEVMTSLNITKDDML